MPRALNRDISVIGGSAGALGPLREIVRHLPPTLPAAIFVAIHTTPNSPGVLARILDKAATLAADVARDGAPIGPGARGMQIIAARYDEDAEQAEERAHVVRRILVADEPPDHLEGGSPQPD